MLSTPVARELEIHSYAQGRIQKLGEGRPLNSHCTFHSETQGFWSILKVIPSNLTVKTVSLTQNVN